MAEPKKVTAVIGVALLERQQEGICWRDEQRHSCPFDQLVEPIRRKERGFSRVRIVYPKQRVTPPLAMKIPNHELR
jgi:hypothetical protein